MDTLRRKLNTKTAKTDFPLIDTLKERWSPRTFDKKPPSEFELRQLLEAARWAASSSNQQPWRFLVGWKGTEAYKKIYDCLSEFNQSWVDSPVLVLAAYKKTFDSGKENFHAPHDLGLALGNMTSQAQHIGIALHHMAGVNWKQAHKKFNVPDDFHVATAVAIGYYGGNVEDLPEDLQEGETKERSRMSQEDFVFSNDWGERL